VNQLNLLPWREYKNKLKIRQFAIVWLCVSCSCLILLFTARILIMQQIKHYQLACDHILFQIKAASPIVRGVKKLQYAEKELTKIIKIIHSNHQRVKKVINFITNLKYLITPDIFVRLIEFHPPYLSLIMHANSEKKYLTLIKFLQFNYDSKLQWLILKYQGLQLDFIVQMMIDKD
jgi:Tfp pilus assembly protein PilN